MKALPPGPFDVCVIDPPASYATWSAKGEGKSPQAQYRTMSTAEIAALPIRDMLAPEAAVFLWTTWPALAAGQAHEILAGWRLFGRTGGAWIKRTASGKLHFGPGKIWRGACEPVLVATAGERMRYRSTTIRNVLQTFDAIDFDGLAREHSRKPQEFYDLVEALTPGARRVDLFARQSRVNWTTWGLERTKYDTRWR